MVHSTSNTNQQQNYMHTIRSETATMLQYYNVKHTGFYEFCLKH